MNRNPNDLQLDQAGGTHSVQFIQLCRFGVFLLKLFKPIEISALTEVKDI